MKLFEAMKSAFIFMEFWGLNFLATIEDMRKILEICEGNLWERLKICEGNSREKSLKICDENL